MTDGIEKISALELGVFALQSNCYWLIIEEATQRHLGVCCTWWGCWWVELFTGVFRPQEHIDNSIIKQPGDWSHSSKDVPRNPGAESLTLHTQPQFPPFRLHSMKYNCRVFVSSFFSESVFCILFLTVNCHSHSKIVAQVFITHALYDFTIPGLLCN